MGMKKKGGCFFRIRFRVFSLRAFLHLVWCYHVDRIQKRKALKLEKEKGEEQRGACRRSGITKDINRLH